MIFLDESGKRWKRIKHSTAGVTLLCVLPVVALLGGSLAYHPQWGVLPLIKQATAVVLTGSAKLRPTSPSPTTPKLTAKAVATATTAIARVAYRPAAASSSTVSSTTTQPATTTTSLPAVATTAANPTQNDFGQSHKPIR